MIYGNSANNYVSCLMSISKIKNMIKMPIVWPNTKTDIISSIIRHNRLIDIEKEKLVKE